MHKSRKPALDRACWFIVGTNKYRIGTYFLTYS